MNLGSAIRGGQDFEQAIWSIQENLCLLNITGRGGTKTAFFAYCVWLVRNMKVLHNHGKLLE